MASHLRIHVAQAAVEAFCRKWNVAELALFGSVLRDDFRPDSDVDVLVRFVPGIQPGWRERVRMVEEAEELFGRRVDLIDRRAVEESPNYIRRRSILESAEVIYGA